jgi:putative tryptophan/tyrosine transport system substrate-binding protein
MIRRRAFVSGLALLTLLPQAARAQSRSVRLGVLLFSDPTSDPNIRAFREGMRELGWIEGQNLSIEYRYAEGRLDRVPELSAELVRTHPTVMFVIGTDIAPALVAATTTIPIVMLVSGDPVKGKLVSSLRRPGGNVTGFTLLASDLAAKRLQLLREAASRITRPAVIWNPEHADDELHETETAARALGLRLRSVEVPNLGQLDAALETIPGSGVDSLIAVSSRTTVRGRKSIIAFAARHRLPLVGGWGLWADDGALMSYGPDPNVLARRAAGYVDRVLRGARVGELPVEQPTKFDLVVNLGTARSLGLAIPSSLLAQADRVIGA